jgi:ABC-type transporter Mla subunit MlaD
MDPLSISASVAGLIMITNSIVTNGFKYLSEFKQSDETIRNLFHEVNLLFGILHSLEKVTERLEADESSHQYTTRIHHINACDNTLRKIAAQLDKVKAKRNKTIDKTRQRLLWTMSKLETQNLLAEVERHKASLSLALSVDEMYVDLGKVEMPSINNHLA